MRIRAATVEDLSSILGLVAEDEISRSRRNFSTEVTPRLVSMLEVLTADPNNELLVGEEQGRVVATLQLTFIPGLGGGGRWRAQVEAVFVAESERGRGFGRQLMEEAIIRARARDCGHMQLTSDKRRYRAHRFYQRMGFLSSHEGIKLLL
jgi:GNAT superfamily N-acetyltransferase